MNSIFTRLLAVGLAVGLPLFSACYESEASAVLTISAIPDKNLSEQAQRLGKVAEYLSTELGVTAKFVPANDYGGVVEAFKNGDVMLCWFGGVSGVQARKAVKGAKAIAQGKVDPQFLTYFVANASTGITKSDDFPLGMKGRSFTFGSSGSTSGRLMPEFYIRQETGAAPQDFFGHENKYSGSHDNTALQVQDGTVECGALNYKRYEELVKTGKIDPALCVHVWTTPPYADYNWTAHPELDKTFGAGFTDKLQKVLVGIDDEQVLAALQRPEGMISARNEDFEKIAETMANVGME